MIIYFDTLMTRKHNNVRGSLKNSKNIKILGSTKYNLNKTGVINDPLDQPTVPAGSDCRWILKFCAGRTYRRTYVRTDGQHVWK